jgi:hypothetical protein
MTDTSLSWASTSPPDTSLLQLALELGFARGVKAGRALEIHDQGCQKWLVFKATDEAKRAAAAALPAEYERLDRIAEQNQRSLTEAVRAIRNGQDGDVFAAVNAGFAEAKRIWDQILARGAK